MNKLTRAQLAALVDADAYGDFRPSTSQEIRTAKSLSKFGLLRRVEGGAFAITSAGESALRAKRKIR